MTAMALTAPPSPLRLSDLNAAAFLLSHREFTFVRAEATDDPRRLEFVITGDETRAQELLAAFWAGTATVQLEHFVGAQRKLKAALHRGSGLRSGPNR